MGSDDFGGGLWILVAINSVIFIAFAASFFHPRSGRDWRVMGAYSAFIVALFTEMYGFPLTIYLMSGWLGDRFPALVPSHAGGHLLNDLIGWQGDPHLSPFHLASYLVMGAGFVMLAKAWPVLRKAQHEKRLATTGPYGTIRHPQYVAAMGPSMAGMGTMMGDPIRTAFQDSAVSQADIAIGSLTELARGTAAPSSPVSR